MEKKYYVVIGMEIHAELKTKSKMWCSCKNESLPDSPNKHICPICLAEPGTLPVINSQAVLSMIKIGLSVNQNFDNFNTDKNDWFNNISNYTEWDRKNYFYPDIPKGYQISQYKYPIVNGGSLFNVPLTRIHLEEDTAKSDHSKGDYTLIDFNRAGVPLMELVTDPVIYNNKEEAAKSSANFCKELQRLLRTLDVSDADMERGEMRLEANISVTTDPKIFGVKCEVKNLNSFLSVEKAIMYEVDRHIEAIENNKQIIQETRGWDEIKQETFSQRKKENSADYRYFPDPDLPKLYLYDIFDIKKIRSELPILPQQKRKTFENIGLHDKQIETLIDNINISNYYLQGLNIIDNNQDVNQNNISNIKKTFANYLLTDALGLTTKNTLLSLPKIDNFIKIMIMIDQSLLSSRGAKDLILDIMTIDKENPDQVSIRAKELNLIINDDPKLLEDIISKVVSENQKEWSEYMAGADKLEMFFVGKCMKAAAGAGNPQKFQEAIKSKR
jgi:aspartyl-tRNA(Asn)/glutamyl-tRNA(Gln) amidotransferase subunit B